jgi:hypothetical protein
VHLLNFYRNNLLRIECFFFAEIFGHFKRSSWSGWKWTTWHLWVLKAYESTVMMSDYKSHPQQGTSQEPTSSYLDVPSML